MDIDQGIDIKMTYSHEIEDMVTISLGENEAGIGILMWFKVELYFTTGHLTFSNYHCGEEAYLEELSAFEDGNKFILSLNRRVSMLIVKVNGHNQAQIALNPGCDNFWPLAIINSVSYKFSQNLDAVLYMRNSTTINEYIGKIKKNFKFNKF